MSLQPGVNTDAPEYIERCQSDPVFRAKHFGPLFGSQEHRCITERVMQWACEEFEREGETSRAYLLGGIYSIVRDMEKELKRLGAAADFLKPRSSRPIRSHEGDREVTL